MKIILTHIYKENEQDEIRSLLTHRASLCALEEMNREFRSLLKHGERTEEQDKIVEKLRDKFWEILKDNNIEIY